MQMVDRTVSFYYSKKEKQRKSRGINLNGEFKNKGDNCKMKIKGEYVLDSIGGETLAVPLGTEEGKQIGIVRLNSVGAFLWELLEEGATEEALIQELTDSYDVECGVAKQDVKNFLTKLEAQGILER